MWDIAQLVFENLTPEMVAAPFAILKAEGWDGGGAPRKPKPQDMIRYIKEKRAANNGQPVDIDGLMDSHHIYEMLAEGPIEYLIAVQDDFVLPEIKEVVLTGFLQGDGERLREAGHKEKIHLRAAALNTEHIATLSAELSHKPRHDAENIIEWGLEIEHAVGRFLNERLRETRAQGFHQTNHVTQPTQALKATLETARVGRLRRAVIAFRLSVTPVPYRVNPSKRPDLELKIADFDTRMTHALDTLSKLEEACKADIAAGKERIRTYQDTQETIQRFYDILETYHDTLVEQRVRLMKDEARDLQSGQNRGSLAEEFMGKKLSTKKDIDDRLHGLRAQMHICRIEYGAHMQMIEAEKRAWEPMNRLIRTQIPLFRQQLMQAQNIRAGRIGVDMDRVSEDLQKLSGQKLANAAAQAIIEGVCAEIDHAVQTFERIAEDEIKAITHAQTLMIEDHSASVTYLEDLREESDTESAPTQSRDPD